MAQLQLSVAVRMRRWALVRAGLWLLGTVTPLIGVERAVAGANWLLRRVRPEYRCGRDEWRELPDWQPPHLEIVSRGA